MISGENSPLVDRFAAKMGITDVAKNCKDKAVALRSFADQRGLTLSEITFMGDDINDVGAMSIAGLSAAPANAVQVAREHATFIASRNGGHGAVRELIDAILGRRSRRHVPMLKLSIT